MAQQSRSTIDRAASSSRRAAILNGIATPAMTASPAPPDEDAILRQVLAASKQQHELERNADDDAMARAISNSLLDQSLDQQRVVGPAVGGAAPMLHRRPPPRPDDGPIIILKRAKRLPAAPAAPAPPSTPPGLPRLERDDLTLTTPPGLASLAAKKRVGRAPDAWAPAPAAPREPPRQFVSLRGDFDDSVWRPRPRDLRDAPAAKPRDEPPRAVTPVEDAAAEPARLDDDDGGAAPARAAARDVAAAPDVAARRRRPGVFLLLAAAALAAAVAGARRRAPPPPTPRRPVAVEPAVADANSSEPAAPALLPTASHDALRAARAEARGARAPPTAAPWSLDGAPPRPEAPTPAPSDALGLGAAADAAFLRPRACAPEEPAATALEWSLSEWLARAAAGSDVVVDVWVGEKLYVHRTIAIPPPVGGAVEPVTLKLNFGKIPDGEHALTIALTSAPVLPRFARQLQRTKILVRQASPAAGPDYAPTVVTG